MQHEKMCELDKKKEKEIPVSSLFSLRNSIAISSPFRFACFTSESFFYILMAWFGAST